MAACRVESLTELKRCPSFPTHMFSPVLILLAISNWSASPATAAPVGMADLAETSDESEEKSKSDTEDRTSGNPEAETEETAAIDLQLKVSGSSAILSAERELSRGISDAAGMKRKARNAAKPVQAVQQEIHGLEFQMQQAQARLIDLNSQLANVTDVASNNRLVGSINTLQGQLQLAEKNLEKLKEAEVAARSELNKTREAYVEHILGLRRSADALKQAYDTVGETEQIVEQLNKLMADSGKQLKFEPSSSFDSTLRKLEELEKTILTEKIPLRGDDNTFYATVVVNGKHTAEMIVDSGASLISLPWKLAAEMGLEPKPGDKQILITIADGSTISGHLKVIDSVRIGQFTVEKVECAVLGPEAVNAQPLLGMSFLGEFQFQLDAAESTLGLTEIDGDNKDRSRRK